MEGEREEGEGAEGTGGGGGGGGGGDDAPSVTLTTFVWAGRPCEVMKSVPTFIPDFFSSAFAPLPIHTKIDMPASRIITSSDTSIDLASEPLATSVVCIEPVESLTLKSLALPPPDAAAVVSLTAPAIGFSPPSAAQKAAGSAPISTTSSLHLPPRSSARMSVDTSSPFAFSFLFASLPFHW